MMPNDLIRQLEEAKNRGDVAGEIHVLEQLLSLSQQAGKVPGEIECLRWLGNAYQEKGELHRAHSYRVEASRLAADPRSGCPPRMQMFVEGDLGRSYIEVQDWQRAETHTRRALQTAEQLHEEQALGIYKINLGRVFSETNRVAEAHRLAEEVLTLAGRRNDHYLLALQHTNLASLLLSHEARLNESMRHARLAISHADQAQRPALRLQAEGLLAEIMRIAGRLTGRDEYGDQAERQFQETADRARALGSPTTELIAEENLVTLYESRGQAGRALHHVRRVLELLERMRQNLGYEEFQLSYFQSSQSAYAHAVEFFLRRGRLEDAFETAERQRSRLLLALLGPARSNTRTWQAGKQQELAAILDDFGREVVQQCAAGARGRLRDLVIGGPRQETATPPPDAAPVLDARGRFLRLYEEQRLLQAQWLPRQSPPVLKLAEVRRLLGPDDALLAYYVTERSLVVFAATQTEAHFQHLNYPRERLAADVEEVSRVMGAVQDAVLDGGEWFRRPPGAPWPQAIAALMVQLQRLLARLFALLAAPVLAVVDAKPHWVIVPHGPLHGLPWAALRRGARYLVEQHSLSLLPSASLAGVLEGAAAAAPGEPLFFADPDPQDATLHLPGTQREVQSGHGVFRSGPPPFTGAAATKAAFLARASGAWLLHFACHHFFDATAPLLSFLKLAGDRGTDCLYAFEIAELSLAAELAVLSACQSGRSRLAAGDEQIGIVRAFLAAGVKSVISTLWSIEDESAAVFFGDFYTTATWQGLARALASAQRRLLADPRYALPYFWAPYVLTGRGQRSLAIPSPGKV
jgi:tetratricopeptide (TPR) repeat protein